MFYRRKILLSVLNSFGGQLDKIDLQKLLLILSKEQDNPTFHFVPYKFGCYSFQANADMNTMIKYNLVRENDIQWQLLTNKNYIRELKNDDRILIAKLKTKFANFSTDDLIRYTYREYPYYACKSIIAADKLSDSEFQRVKEALPVNTSQTLFTIGYEGLTSEQYFNKLLKYDVKILCDVRNYPRSMKYGFSKNQLINACCNLGIEYIHLPGLGIVSDKRKSLKSQSDYDSLFKEYRATTLKQNVTDKGNILKLLAENKRVAITCFEKNIHQCHRYHLAKSLAVSPDWDYSIKHI